MGRYPEYCDSVIEYEEDLDKLSASLLIMQDKELPKELEQRIIRKNSLQKDRDNFIQQKRNKRKPAVVQK